MSTGIKPDPTEPKRRDSRDYTPDQHKAVLRVMRCSVTAYYEILAVEKTCSDGQVKKAYRKLSLVVHPDKNAAPQADEAFKRVSKAFQVLSDADKRRVYDQTGSDPEDRAGPSGFNGFAGAARRGPGMYAQQDDIFNMFFGGAGGNPFAQFGGAGGPQVFTFGGNGFQFGGQGFGNAQRARARAAGNAGQGEQPNWVSYIPLVGLVLIMLLVQFFTADSGTSAASLPGFRFQAQPPYVQERRTPNYNVQFFVNPKDIKKMQPSRIRNLDRHAELTHINNLRKRCQLQFSEREKAIREAQGWFSRDEDAYQTAIGLAMPDCERLDDLGLTYQTNF